MTEHKPLEKNNNGFWWKMDVADAIEGLKEELKVLLDKFGYELECEEYTEDFAMKFQSKADKLINKWFGGKE